MLSDRYIRNASVGLHADELGLYLKVYPSGKRSFVMRSQIAGKDTTKTLGAYPKLGLADARALLGRMLAGNERKTVGAACCENSGKKDPREPMTR